MIEGDSFLHNRFHSPQMSRSHDVLGCVLNSPLHTTAPAKGPLALWNPGFAPISWAQGEQKKEQQKTHPGLFPKRMTNPGVFPYQMNDLFLLQLHGFLALLHPVTYPQLVDDIPIIPGLDAQFAAQVGHVHL